MIRSRIYDTLVMELTARWYARALERMPEGARVLDVGIGTAGALAANAATVRTRDLHITGIDIDADYVARARKRVREHPALAERCEVYCESVHKHRGGPYDVIYFSASFMLLPEPVQALRHCRELLAPRAQFLFTQTIQRRQSRWMETLKPILKWFTTIDFGEVTYEDSFRDRLAAAGLTVVELSVLQHHGSRDSCLAVAVPSGG